MTNHSIHHNTHDDKQHGSYTRCDGCFHWSQSTTRYTAPGAVSVNLCPICTWKWREWRDDDVRRNAYVYNDAPAPMPHGYTEIPNVVLDVMPHIPASQYLVLLALSQLTHGANSSTTTISLQELCTMTGLSLSSVSNAANRLVASGYVQRHRGDYGPYLYAVDIDAIGRHLQNLQRKNTTK